jgi:hypothetical protein
MAPQHEPTPAETVHERDARIRIEERELTSTAGRLALLQRDHRKFLDTHSPLTLSLKLALMKPIGDVVARYERHGQANESGDPTEPASVPAIIAVAEAMVAKAARGDTTAFALMADRLEGKVGMRRGDIGEDELRNQSNVARTVIEVVEALDKAKRGIPIDADYQVVDAKVKLEDT